MDDEATGKVTSDNPEAAEFDAEWQQFEAELQGVPATGTESSTISYPQLQIVHQTQADVYDASFQLQSRDGAEKKDDKDSEEEIDDDSAAYSPSSEPILDLFSDRHQVTKQVNEEQRSVGKSDGGSTSSHKCEPSEKDHKRKDEKSSHSRHRSHSRSRSRDRSSHRSKHHHSRHRHSRDRHHKHRQSSNSSSSSSSRSRSRSSDDRHRRSHHSPDRKRSDDSRGRHGDSRRHHDERGLSTATVGNYGPRSAEQMEKQRQLNAAVLNQKQTTKRVGKNKTFIPNRNGPNRSDGGAEGPSAVDEGNAPPSQPPKRFSRKFDSKLTPQERAAALQKQVEDATGIQMPKYYNPAAINPLKYAEQMQKRKLLWSKAKEGKGDNESLWQNTALALDSSASNKFQKLMGLKSGEEQPGGDEKKSSVSKQVVKHKQEQLFDQLDREYEFARMSTHTHRGMGLGFQSAAAEKATLVASANSSNTTSSTTK